MVLHIEFIAFISYPKWTIRLNLTGLKQYHSCCIKRFLLENKMEYKMFIRDMTESRKYCTQQVDSTKKNALK